MIIEINVAEITVGDVVVNAGIRYTIRKKEVEPGFPHYRLFFMEGHPKPWLKHIDDSLPVEVP